MTSVINCSCWRLSTLREQGVTGWYERAFLSNYIFDAYCGARINELHYLEHDSMSVQEYRLKFGELFMHIDGISNLEKKEMFFRGLQIPYR